MSLNYQEKSQTYKQQNPQIRSFKLYSTHTLWSMSLIPATIAKVFKGALSTLSTNTIKVKGQILSNLSGLIDIMQNYK